jgi:hypothetical protein
MDDEHVLAFVEAVHRTHFDAVGIFALNAVVGDDIGHGGGLCGTRMVNGDRRKALRRC